ncbi:MAG: hypothetical protein PHQ50_06820, partial [Eubacteriales bacterium]|nr:hypothetical protein [Eubacteriales bacterium]
LEGVLPTKLKFVQADNEAVSNRFYKACIGWIRYKPLMLYITQQEEYEEKISEIREQLRQVLPKICDYFDNLEYENLLVELEKYNKNVMKHYREFIETKNAWEMIMNYYS